jgi:hypothetical protein
MAGNPIIFVGPSLCGPDPIEGRGFERRPPAAQGDVYRAALEKPRAIGIIDGYFHGAPSVWHKEILWTMSQGIHVFGAASMGALRAAELRPFGMRGVGRVFEAYRDGALSDDDEVALIHGPPDLGYPSLSEPMVNIRATLDRAVSESIITSDARTDLLTIAKSQFYQSRSWETVLAEAEREAVQPQAVAVLRAWLPTGAIDQKREDALALIDEIGRFLATDPPPMQPEFAFEYTEMWANAPWLDRGAGASATSHNGDTESNVLDELRLMGPHYFDVRDRALLLVLADGDAAAPDAPLRKQVLMEVDAFRRAHGLMRQESLAAWLESAGIDMAQFERMMADKAQTRKAALLNAERLQPRIVDQLRLSGDYQRLATRGQDKRNRLNGRKLSKAPRHVLLERHFERLQCSVPGDIDSYSVDLGLPDSDALLRLLQKEENYLDIVEGSGKAE